MDRTAVVLNDPINGRQAESQAGSHPLGGKPRVEDPVEILGWDASARVRKLEHSRLAFLIGCDRDGSFPIDGLNRIHEEVHEGLIQLTGRALYLRYRAVIPALSDLSTVCRGYLAGGDLEVPARFGAVLPLLFAPGFCLAIDQLHSSEVSLLAEG